jgi:uncharacterized membrane protein YdjX (TVP38/TMEM64 family)
MKNQKKIIKYTLTALAYAIGVVGFYFLWKTGKIEEFVKWAGVFGPIAFVFITALKSVFPIIPGEVLAVLGVLLFGPIFGLTYTLIGLTIGSIVAFSLAKEYGQPFVEFAVGKERFEKVHGLTGDRTLFTFFLIYLLPGTPDDVVTYIGGLTGLSLHTFILVVFFGRLPTYILYILAGTSLLDLNFKLMIMWYGVLIFLTAILFMTKRQFEKREKK